MRQFRGSITQPGSRHAGCLRFVPPLPRSAGTRKTRLRLAASLVLPLRYRRLLAPCIRTALKSRSPFAFGLGFALFYFPSRLSPSRFQQKVSNSIYLISLFPFYGFILAQWNYDPMPLSSGAPDNRPSYIPITQHIGKYAHNVV